MELNLYKYKFTQTWYINSEIRKVLLKHVDKNRKYNILEIGSFEGLSACGFSDNILDHPDSTLDCVDPYILSGTNDKITTQCVTSKTEQMFKNNIGLSKNSNKITHHKMMSDEFFLNNKKSFNFIYIDGCHEQEFVKNDVENSFDCLEENGIMWMDDYCRMTGNKGTLKPFIDSLLEQFDGCYDIIHKNYQLAIKKKHPN